MKKKTNRTTGDAPRTSAESPILLNHLLELDEGWLALTLAPGKKTQGTYVRWDRSLGADLDRLIELGATTLVPLLTDDELERLKIPALIPEAEQRGLVVRRFPFHDGGIPTSLAETRKLVLELVARVFNQQERVVVHCNGGLGRAGTIGACVLLESHRVNTVDEAIARVREVRGARAIETAAQERFIAEYAQLVPR